MSNAISHPERVNARKVTRCCRVSRRLCRFFSACKRFATSLLPCISGEEDDDGNGILESGSGEMGKLGTQRSGPEETGILHISKEKLQIVAGEIGEEKQVDSLTSVSCSSSDKIYEVKRVAVGRRNDDDIHKRKLLFSHQLELELRRYDAHHRIVQFPGHPAGSLSINGLVEMCIWINKSGICLLEILNQLKRRNDINQVKLKNRRLLPYRNRFKDCRPQDPMQLQRQITSSAHFAESPNLNIDLSVTLEELYFGCVKKLIITKYSVCECFQDLNTITWKLCYTCNGQGSGWAIDNLSCVWYMSLCPTCCGAGKQLSTDFSYEAQNQCRSCDGSLITKVEKELVVDIPRGWKDGKIILMKNAGHHLPGCVKGAIVVKVKQIPHPDFKRKNDSLHMNINILLGEALCGLKRVVYTIDHKPVIIKTSMGHVIAPGDTKVLVGKGMPVFNSVKFGNLLIEFSVIFPIHLQPTCSWTELKELLEPSE